MKAIQQLIGYFDAQGMLRPDQVEHLVAKGYWGTYTSADIRSLQAKIGQSFPMQATGNLNGPLWGTDTYTSDSDLGTACVHAGLLAPGETGTVRVTMQQPIALFPGTTRNGVTSRVWTNGWPGAYSVELLRK